MSKRVQVVLLAVAALAAVAVASVRIARAVTSKRSATPREQPIYGATPAEEASTRAALRAPPGFQANACLWSAKGELCFFRLRGEPFNQAVMRGFLRALGSRLVSQESSIECSQRPPPAPFPFARCDARAFVGRDLVVVSAHSAFPAPQLETGHAQRPARVRWIRSHRGAAEVKVYVIGHCLVRGQCETPGG